MSLLSPTFKWTRSGVPYQTLYVREREHLMNEIVPNVTPATIKPMPLANPGVTRREEVFNEVIYVLEVLNRAVVATTSIDPDGVTLALEMVKAMKEEEQQ